MAFVILELGKGGKTWPALVISLILLSASLPLTEGQGVAEQPIARRSLVIALGDGLTTDAELTFPYIGVGPYPGVLLVHGSGPIDMDAYIPPEVAPPGEPVKLFLQIAEYLSERGFAVLRYNKRGVGLNDTIVDQNVYTNITFQDLVRDAETALGVLRQQPEVDASDTTIIGHSEGTLIAPRIAIRDPNVSKLVLMSAAAHGLQDILYWQVVDRNIDFAEGVDADRDGLLSIQEVLDTERRGELPPQSLQSFFTNTNGTYEWYPGLDANNDGYFSIHEEWEPFLIQTFSLITTTDPSNPFYDKWIQSHLTLTETNLDLIGNIPASILILNGENDIQTPVQEAFLLAQRLTEAEHPDHTLITYPGLGHSFYPAKGLNQPLGAIENRVLSDLFSWLENPSRTFRYDAVQIEANQRTNADLQGRLAEQNNVLSLQARELEDAGNRIRELEGQTQQLVREVQEARTEADEIRTTQARDLDAARSRIAAVEGETRDLRSRYSDLQNASSTVDMRTRELQSGLSAAMNLGYTALGIATIAFIAVVVVGLRRQQS